MPKFPDDILVAVDEYGRQYFTNVNRRTVPEPRIVSIPIKGANNG